MPHHTHSHTARGTAKSSKNSLHKAIFQPQPCLLSNFYTPVSNFWTLTKTRICRICLIYCNIGILARFWQ